MKKLHLLQRKDTVTKKPRAGLTINSRPLVTPAEAHTSQFTMVWGQYAFPPLRLPCPRSSVYEILLILQDLPPVSLPLCSLAKCCRCQAKWITSPSLLPLPSWCCTVILDPIPVSDARRVETAAQSPLFHSQDLTKDLAPPKSVFEKSIELFDRIINSTSIPSGGNIIWCVLQV